MYWLEFNGKNTQDYDLLIQSLTPKPRPQKRFAEIIVDGRHGTLTVTDDTYSPFSWSQEFVLTNLSRLAEVKALFSSSGKLVTSDNPNKFYNAKAFESMAVENINHAWKKVTVQFYVQPFCYATTQETIFLEEAGMIYNIGDVEAQPIITVYGAGDLTVYVNGQGLKVKNVVESAIVDCQNLLAYEGMLPRLTVGDFPVLQTGENTISFNVATKIDIAPNWRWF